MNARAAVAAILVLSVALPSALPQEAAKKGIPCDLATVEEALWCAKCKKFREKEQLEGEKCKECQTPVDKIKVCVKKWIPSCGMHQQTPHLEPCCKSKMCCKLQTLKSALVFRCEGCGQSAREEKDIKHDAKSHEQKIVKSCEASGTQPHGGEPIKQP
jgi:hypothetical protein